ncbi:hypothetical protein NM04_26035 [Massilia aurea]|uniref:DUF262 domain-containing protein n=1 Tax=Massilia aurea TaxID=373040 RepID=A0A422QD98_9BURK|nr:DUF262 domain-containing protein [Massilia aurea]RNF27904.1 hypothetical protein NM04_26035 [Massilia aurea]
MTTTHNFAPVTVGELLGQQFFVPRYQRGYRWTPRQVHELLNDVLAFIDRPNGSFYCLQPVVVLRNGGRWDVVDGQQRLTTLSLIMTYFNSRMPEDEAWDVFELDYETRPESRAYLKRPLAGDEGKYVDFAYIHGAYQAVRDWFAAHPTRRGEIESALLNKVKVIWYQLEKNEDPVAMFMRLNVGKIPLTGAELVKGLFLRSGNFEGEDERIRHLKQTRIAREWDDIERRLQEDSFWYFLTNETRTSNRIDFLLRLHAQEIGVEAMPDDPSWLFLAFSKRLNDEKADVMGEWANIRQLFLRLDEWYRDRDFYHLVGYLAATGRPLSSLLELADCNKGELRRRLKAEMLPPVAKGDVTAENIAPALQAWLEDLDYEKRGDHRAIRQALLLFNIATLLESDRVTTRFPFDLFKTESWDLEHIRSVQSALPESPDRAAKWLDSFLGYVTGTEDPAGWRAAVHDAPVGQIDALCIDALHMRNATPFPMKEFPALAQRIIEKYDAEPDREADNTIGNLTLLDAATNRSYKNAVFPIKRKTLIDLDRSGTFVPVCTKNVFLKYYSPMIDDMLVWTAADAAAHQAALHTALVRFFAPAQVQA